VNRSVAMMMAGAVTTLAVIGGTLAISQSGALAGGTNILKNGEIAVQVSTVEVSPVVSATDEPVAQLSDPTATVEDTPVADTSSPAISDLEATLRARLDQAYKLLSERDGMYQARLKEAYAKLKLAEAAANTVVTTTIQADVQPAPAPAAAVVVVNPPQHQDEHHDEHSDDHEDEGGDH
jgi:hypothetical protein